MKTIIQFLATVVTVCIVGCGIIFLPYYTVIFFNLFIGANIPDSNGVVPIVWAIGIVILIFLALVAGWIFDIYRSFEKPSKKFENAIIERVEEYRKYQVLKKEHQQLKEKYKKLKGALSHATNK